MQFRGVVSLSVILVLTLWNPGIGSASEDDSGDESADGADVAVALADATPSKGRFIFEKVRAVLVESPDVRLSSADELLASFDSSQVPRTEFAKTMKRRDLDGLIIYGRQSAAFSLTIIDAAGTSRGTVRTDTDSERVSDRVVIDALSTAIERLKSESPEGSSGEAESVAESVEESGSARESSTDMVSLPERTSAELEPGAGLSVGAFFGRRALSLSTEGGFDLSHTTPLVGVQARVEGVFGLNQSGRGGFGATGFVRYAPFSSEFTGTQGSLRGSYIRAGAALRYLGRITPTVTVYGQLGGEFSDLGIESNGTYVGSRYTSIDAGVGVVQRFPGAATLGFYVGALPTLFTRTNGQAFGDGAVSVGAKGGFDFTLTALDPVRIGVGYDLQWLNPRHPQPNTRDSPASGNDVVHAGSLRVGFGF